jgi:hypothetical protein
MTLPITSCQSERNSSEILMTKKQISINHTRGKIELSFYSLYGKLYNKIVVILRGEQRVCIQNYRQISTVEVCLAVN